MITGSILSEYRRDNKSAVIEKLHNGYKDQYRVIVATRFTTLAAAESAFLSEVSTDKKKYCSKQIKNRVENYVSDKSK